MPDIVRGAVRAGATARSRRDAFIARWAGRGRERGARQPEARAAVREACAAGHADDAARLIGQAAGLIGDVLAAGGIVERHVAEAGALLREGPPRLARAD
jgi:nitronate monooxygenase